MRSKNIRSLGRPRAFNDKIEQNTVKSLDRALTVLTTLSKNQNKTLTDLSKELSHHQLFTEYFQQWLYIKL